MAMAQRAATSDFNQLRPREPVALVPHVPPGQLILAGSGKAPQNDQFRIGTAAQSADCTGLEIMAAVCASLWARGDYAAWCGESRVRSASLLIPYLPA